MRRVRVTLSATNVVYRKTVSTFSSSSNAQREVMATGCYPGDQFGAPPATKTRLPVTYEESSDAKNRDTPAKSSGAPALPRGMLLPMFSKNASLSAPGGEVPVVKLRLGRTRQDDVHADVKGCQFSGQGVC
jgi:hypothetical protein